MVEHRLITATYGCLVLCISHTCGVPCTEVKNIWPQTLQAGKMVHIPEKANTTSDVHCR